MQRKPGGYRKPTEEQRRLSRLSKEEHSEWFQQFWNLTGASTKQHPAPFPYELAHRLVRMFSFHGDVVLDPFCGTGTTVLAAMKTERRGIGIGIDIDYLRMAWRRLHHEMSGLFGQADLAFFRTTPEQPQQAVREDLPPAYRAKPIGKQKQKPSAR